MIIKYLLNKEEWSFIKNLLGKLFKYSNHNYSKTRWPIFMNLFITGNCNSQCEFCWRVNRESTSYINLKKISELASSKIPIILITGGEPTIHPEFCKIIDILNQKYTKIYILTNGLEPEILLDTIKDRSNIRVIIAFMPGMSDAIINKKIETIEKLAKSNIPIYINLVVDVDEEDIKSIPKENFEKIFKWSRRVYVTKKLKGFCNLSKYHIQRLNTYSEQISRKYKILVIAPVYPNFIQRLILNGISKFIYSKPITICSGYPLKASFSEDGKLSDCLYLKSELKIENKVE